MAFLFTFPLYWIITGAFKTGKEINSTTPVWFPSEWDLGNFQRLMSKRSAPLFDMTIPSLKISAFGYVIRLGSTIKITGPTVPAAIRWLINTVFMSVAAMLITCLTSAMAGYVLAKKRFWGKSLVEAAEVDGATQMQAFWKIKWPQMMPTTLYILVITTINSFQCFALIQLLTLGGPNNSTMTIMYYIYYNAFKLYKYGYGNAMGVILAIIIAILSAVQFKLGEEK